MHLPPLFNFTSFAIRFSTEVDSGLSRASPESGVLPVELAGDVPSLNKSLVLASEFTIDQGRGLLPITGVDFSFRCFNDSESSKIERVTKPPQFTINIIPALLLQPDTLLVKVLESDDASEDAPESSPSLSFETNPSPVNRLVNGEAVSAFLTLIGEYFSKLSLERDRGAGFIKPLSSGEFLFSFGVLRPSLKFGEAKS